MPSNSIYPKTSAYSDTGIVQGRYLDVMTNRPIPWLGSDVSWTITTPYEYRPDLLAYDLYSDARLWWVFAQRNPNKLKDPLFDFTVGKSIYIPKLDTLKTVLGI